MRHLPTKEYNGLTVVLSNPSRFDRTTLLSGHAGIFFNDDCLSPYSSRWRCDIRTADTIQEGILPGTRGILLLGESALHLWGEGYESYTIKEQRGNPIRGKFKDVHTLCSFSPQDCLDPRDYESRLNPLLKNLENEDRDSSESEEAKFRHGKTQRKNFRHWLVRDTQKLLWRLAGNIPYENPYKIKVYPHVDEVVKILLEARKQNLYYDIETDSDRNMLCFGFSVENSTDIYSIPIIRYDYTLAYGKDTYNILRALAVALYRNRLVIHYCSFDLIVCALKYRMGFSHDIYDTMSAQHRCFPEAEISLGHSLSSWPQIWEPFHKDEGIFEPQNVEQEKQLWFYNGKDVAAMRLIKRAQEEYGSIIPGIAASIDNGNSHLYSFLLNTLMGILVDDGLRQQYMKENDTLMTNYLRAIRYLVGPDVDLLPSSSKSCINYFHTIMDYPIMARSEKTGMPKLDEINLWKLKLKNPDNIVLDFVIKYRQTLKESGMLNFVSI